MLKRKSQRVFGSVVEIDPTTKDASIYASGMRNAQGSFWDSDTKQLFESEHGPFGGDEVNILKRGDFYGWPKETFGKPYPTKYPSGKEELNQARNPRIGVDTELKNFGFVSGEHDNSSLPLISWSPGRGAGNLIKVSKESPLRDWRGNLLVAHMGTRQFHRLIIRKNMVVHDEEIQLNYRVRDFSLTERGILVISTDEGLLFALQTYSSKLD